MTPIVVSDWKGLAKVLVETNELDPTYPVVKYLLSSHDQQWCGRFLLHYTWFYNLKEAILIADTSNERFWDTCTSQALGTEVKRGGARRHFRGVPAVKAISIMSGKNRTPWAIICDMYKPHYPHMVHYIEKEYKGTNIGPYYTWKLMDWFDICLGWPIGMSVDDAVKFMPDVPKEAAAEMFPGQPFKEVLEMMLAYVSTLPHPVKKGKCGLAEVETILCALKGYFKTKAHWIGDDITDTHVNLVNFPGLLQHIPVQIPHGTYTRGDYHGH